VRDVAYTSAKGVGGGERLRRLAAGFLWGFSWAWTGAIGVAAAFLWWSGDRWWPGTVLLFGPRWTLGLPALLLLPAALFLSRRSQVPLAVGLALFLVPLMGFRASLPKRPAADDLTVLTINVARAEDLHEPLAEMVARSGADLVAIQECPHRVRVPPSLEIEGYHFHSHLSLCFLSRFPFSVGDVAGQAPVADTATGIAARYEVVLSPGDTLSVTNVHLPTPRDGLEDIRMGRIGDGIQALRRDRLFRIQAARDGRRVADGGGVDRIVLGDFNAPPESRIQREHWRGYTNAFDRAGFGFGFTRYNGWIRARIDHVLFTGRLQPVSARVGDDVGSDHRPVMVRFRRMH